jgi:neutral ceramidase
VSGLLKITFPVLAGILPAALLPYQLFAAEPADGTFKAGVAVRIITPAEPLWMSGYGGRTKPGEGKVHDLYVKALALEDAKGGRLVLLTSDLVGFSHAFAEAVAEAVRKQSGLPRERLCLTVSHTHTGPLLDGPLVDSEAENVTPEQEKKVKEYTKQLRGWMVEVIVAALADLRPARLAAGQGTARFATNRRLPTSRGFALAPNPEGPVDRDVPVLRVESPEGKLRAVAFGYACHNTTLDDDRWCGDYAGFAQAELEKKHPGAVALFWTGCGGDAGPPRRGMENCRRYGRELADAVEGVLDGHPRLIRGELAVRYAQIALPYDRLPSKEQLTADASSKQRALRNPARKRLKLLEAGGTLDDHYRHYPIQVVRLGDGPLWIVLGGEAVVDYKVRLKRELGRDRALWVTSYANDIMAYIPSLRVLREGGYEGDTSRIGWGMPAKWAPPVEEKIVEKVHELVKEVAAKKP